ncbi:2'-5' RNA ligase superfamily protein [Actinocorallia herbida]|uniref:2'-5' RNA ligase superfamily protein n=1 Tax=Actinocorallia herbida TaxID=58109 RepID=A0A3N1DAN4_9ACTN|nr:2'-5' RNA ligase family protein [Actinocorallia herbida]ROO90593.1 2'-5' RNA ligase superfamily protein [Actinocorallia herbida]
MTPRLHHDEESFPAAPPSDLHDPAAILTRDWDAYRDLDTMKDHWDRARWHPEYRAYYWMLTFPEAPDLLKLARHCQDALAPLGMDNIPEDGLHITMTKIGETDRVTPNQLADLAATTLPTRFTLTAHPLIGSRGAARFTITPWHHLADLHQTLTTANARAGVPGGRPTPSFRPHLGVAYNNRPRPAQDLLPYLLSLHALLPVRIAVRSVELVELRREDAAYRWTVLHSLPLNDRLL